MLRKILAVVLFLTATLCFGQYVQTSTLSATGVTNGVSEASAVAVHVLSWVTTGSPTGCTIQLESASTFSGSYTLIGSAQTCTSSGNYVLTGTTANFVHVNLATLSGGSSPTVTYTYSGVPPQYAQTGTLTDGEAYIPLTNCFEVASANAGANDGKIVVSGSMASLTGQVTTTGNTQFTCTFALPPNRVTANKQITITDLTWLVGTVTTQPTSITNVTFKTHQPPAAAASEVLASATLVDATGGATTLLPTSAQFAGFAVGAAGQAWNIKETFTTNPTVASTQLFTATITFNQSAAAAMVTPLFGLVVHYNYVQ